MPGTPQLSKFYFLPIKCGSQGRRWHIYEMNKHKRPFIWMPIPIIVGRPHKTAMWYKQSTQSIIKCNGEFVQVLYFWVKKITYLGFFTLGNIGKKEKERRKGWREGRGRRARKEGERKIKTFCCIENWIKSFKNLIKIIKSFNNKII